MAYCTVEEAESAGATGSEADIEAAIADATERIDRFTGDRFEPTDLTVTTTFGSDGIATLPLRPLSLTSVTPVSEGVALTATTYRMRSSGTYGDFDAVELVNGGRAGERVTVAGSFGWAAVPAGVRRACALIAAFLTGTPTAASEGPLAGVEALSVEGYSVRYGARGGRLMATTGVAEADTLLDAYRRNPVTIA